MLSSAAFTAEQCSDWRGLWQNRHNDLIWMVGYLPLFSFPFVSSLPSPFSFQVKKSPFGVWTLGSLYFLAPRIFLALLDDGRGRDC